MTWLRWSAAGLLLLGCNIGSDLSSATSRVRLHLTDAPGPDIESAMVWISRAYLIAGSDSGSDSTGRVIVTDEPQEYDLLELQDGITALLGDAEVPAAEYSQLRLVVDSARLTLADGFTFADGSTTRSLKVPSGGQSGIKVSFPGKLDLTEDVDVVVDFDVAQNFVFQGPPARPHDVLFTPHLKGSVQPLQP